MLLWVRMVTKHGGYCFTQDFDFSQEEIDDFRRHMVRSIVTMSLE